jgi:hypothetical protein
MVDSLSKFVRGVLFFNVIRVCGAAVLITTNELAKGSRPYENSFTLSAESAMDV